jgi:hypothetical protein
VSTTATFAREDLAAARRWRDEYLRRAYGIATVVMFTTALAPRTLTVQAHDYREAGLALWQADGLEDAMTTGPTGLVAASVWGADPDAPRWSLLKLVLGPTVTSSMVAGCCT